jgi:flagellar basal body rod protein FlgF
MSLREDIAMNIVVVFDTQFGNTQQMARAIGDAFPSTVSVRVQKAGEISMLNAEPNHKVNSKLGDVPYVLLPNHSLERTRPARRFRMKESWPGRSAQCR